MKIIRPVIEGRPDGNELHLRRKRKRKDDHLIEIKIADRFGVIELPHTVPRV